MTTKLGRIPIPLRQRLLRARYRVMPLLVFALAIAGTVMLWGRHTASPNAFGAVDAVRYDINSPASGLLLAESLAPLDVFARVEAGQLIARLDDTSTRHALAALRADIAAIEKEIVAEQAKAKHDDALREQDLQLAHRRLALDVEARRLELVDRKAEYEEEKIKLQRREEQLIMATRLRESNAETELGVLNYKLERDVAAQRVQGFELSVKEAEQQSAAAEARFNEQPVAVTTIIDAIIAPLSEKVKAAQAKLDELEAQAQLLHVRSPVSGTVAMVYKRPGQVVKQGEPIFTIADTTPHRIVSYVRSDQRIDPKPGMVVVIRSRMDPSKVVESQVVDVGSQVEPIPTQHLRASNVPEWGVPVGIAIPADGGFRPGELVDLVLRR